MRIKLFILVVTAAPSALAACGSLATASRGATAPESLSLQEALDAVVAAGAPGAVVLVRDGDRTTAFASGFGNLARRTPMRVSDRFRIGSVTKTLHCDRCPPARRRGEALAPGHGRALAPGPRPRRAEDHRPPAAQPDERALRLPARPERARPYLRGDRAYVWTPRKLVGVATSHRADFAPGARWAYSNTNYVPLGLIVESATRKPVGTELQRRIFAPLDLRATTFDSLPRIAGPHARGYDVLGGRRADVSVLSRSITWAAGAIVSTADDVARFYRALLRGRLLRAELLRTMETTVPMGTSGESYGLGLWKTRTMGLSKAGLPCRLVWATTAVTPAM